MLVPFQEYERDIEGINLDNFVIQPSQAAAAADELETNLRRGIGGSLDDAEAAFPGDVYSSMLTAHW